MFAKTFKRGLLPPVVAVLLVLATFCEVPVYTDDYEPNDTFEDAALISLGTITATIEPEEDEDYYQVNIGGADSLMLIYRLTVPSVLMPEITFYSSTQKFLDRNRADAAGEAIHDSLRVAPGEVVLRIRSFNYEASEASYTLVLSTSTAVALGN
ncbi:MAG: hypothetical protein E3J71_06140 [Candidatus Stahlbacteria bacterium]|nr:MAG: hypothetical protein E3J71_06140 [Candidatus Stahlbacteria bacterium]